MKGIILALALGGCATGGPQMVAAPARPVVVAQADPVAMERRAQEAREAEVSQRCNAIYDEPTSWPSFKSKAEAEAQLVTIQVWTAKEKACRELMEGVRHAQLLRAERQATESAERRSRLDAEYASHVRSMAVMSTALQGIGKAMQPAPSTTVQTKCTPDYAGGMNCVSH